MFVARLRGLMAVAGALVAGSVFGQNAPPNGSYWEQVKRFLPEEGDVAMNQVVSLFGPPVTAATGFVAEARESVLGVTIYYFLVGVFVISILMALYLFLAGTAQSAHSGKFLGERWNGFWVPLRAVLAWMLLLPLPALGGLAGVHALLFWALAIGTGFANKVGMAGIDATADHGFSAVAATLAAEPMASQLARNTLNALSCVETVNRVESTPGGYPPLGVSTKEEEPKKGIWGNVKEFFSGTPKGAQYNDLINAAAAKYGMPASFIHAIMAAESGYNPDARSPKNAQGLMQLIPDTAKRFGVTNAYDPAQNIDGGTHYLRWLYDRFGGDLKLVAAAYNAGEGAVQKYGNTIPPYSETRNYVSKVMNNYQKNGGGTPGEVAGTSLRHYLFGGGQYAADLCGDIPLPVRTVTENTDFNGVQTAMRNDIQSRHVTAYETMLDGLRGVIAQLQAGEETAAAEAYARLVQDYANTVFQAGVNAYQTRQGEMIAQWKESAKKDGWGTYGMWFWQLADANIAVTTALNEMVAEQKGLQPELKSLSKETADQVRIALARTDAILNALQTASVPGTEGFASWRATRDVSANFNYAVPAGGRAFDQAAENDHYKIFSSQLQEAFRWLQPGQTNEFPLLTWYRFGHTLMTVGAWAMVTGAVTGIASTAAGLMIGAMGGAVFGMGWLLSIYLAYLPLLIWLVQFLAWLLLAVIAAFGMPLWMLMHLSGEGEGISGARAQSGYGLLLSLLLKPALLVFGLYASIALIYILGWFINATIGTTLKNPPNSVFECLGLIAIYVLVVVASATLCLRVISMIPEMAFRWIDVVAGSSFAGSALETMENGARGGGREIGAGGANLTKVTGDFGERYRRGQKDRRLQKTGGVGP